MKKIILSLLILLAPLSTFASDYYFYKPPVKLIYDKFQGGLKYPYSPDVGVTEDSLLSAGTDTFTFCRLLQSGSTYSSHTLGPNPNSANANYTFALYSNALGIVSATEVITSITCTIPDAPPPTPTVTSQPITGYFSQGVEVQSGAYTWNMTLNLDSTGVTLGAVQDIQIWNAFKVVSATTSDKTITLALAPSQAPLDVACGTYTLNIPAGALQSSSSTNKNPILGSFSVVGCPLPTPVGTASGNTASGATPTYGSGLSQSGSYLSVFRKDDTGNYFLDISNAIFLVGLISFFAFLFYGIFIFTKHSFLGKK